VKTDLFVLIFILFKEEKYLMQCVMLTSDSSLNHWELFVENFLGMNLWGEAYKSAERQKL